MIDAEIVPRSGYLGVTDSKVENSACSLCLPPYVCALHSANNSPFVKLCHPGGAGTVTQVGVSIGYHTQP